MMKKTLFFLIMNLIVLSLYCQWDYLYGYPNFPYIGGIEFNQSGNGMIAGFGDNNGYILTTTDLGTSWDTVYVLPNFWFWDLSIANDTTAYIVGNDNNINIIAKTTDFGITWDTLLFYDSLLLRTIDFPNDSIGYAGGISDRLLKTTDSGNNWFIIQPNQPPASNLYDFDFKNSLLGYCGVHTKTIDGGNNWTYNSSVPSWYGNLVSYPNDSLGYYVYPIDFSCDSAYLYKTIDYGQSWTIQNTINTSVSSEYVFRSLCFVNDTIGYAGGCFQCHKTTDGGLNWFSQDLSTDFINNFYFLNPDTGFAIISEWGEALYRTFNGGSTSIDDNISYSINSVNIYPNPTTSFISIENNEFKKVEIINSVGQSIIKSNHKKINLSGIPTGLYYVRVYFDSKVITKKIMKI
ncbi:T9SS type A sorting domain-containing protein [Patescibacteria group bacterium]|nr:T9SS type A sorting domain-containing protein [Patescibacteria group bacterium]